MSSLISMFVGPRDQIIIYTCFSGEVAVMIYNSDDTSDMINSSILCDLQWNHLPDLGQDGK